MSETNYRSKLENDIGIVGENILVNNKIVTAMYIVDSLNYQTLNEAGIRSHIDRLESLATSLGTHRPGIKFSMFNVNKVLTPDDVKTNLIDTVRMWDPSYEGIPEVFDGFITKNAQTFTILAVNIETKNMNDIDTMTIKDVFRSLIDSAAQELFSFKNVKIDTQKLVEVERSIYDIVSNYGVRTSRELTFYSYVSSIFPSYEISYNTNSYVENNMAPILGAVKQEIKSHFGGYFEMSNVGVELFGLPAQVTYGSVVNILSMPKKINSDSFNMQINNLRINIKTLPRDKARLTMKRSRADIEFEEEQATEANLRQRDKEYLEDGIDLANEALDSIGQGKMICEMNASILVLAKSPQELKEKRQSIISSLADIDIVASPSLSQDTSFINNFVKMNLPNADYNHLCDIRYPLSFQIDKGVMVGDSDGKYHSPAIGTSL